MASLRKLAVIKIIPENGLQNIDLFYEIYTKALADYSAQAVAEAVEAFIHHDERNEFNKHKYPQPDELRDMAAEKQDMIDWRCSAPKPLGRPPSASNASTMPDLPENMTKDQVLHACRLIMQGKTMEQAVQDVLSLSLDKGQ